MTRQGQDRTLGNEHDGAAGGLDLLLGDLGDELRLDDDRLVGQQTLAEHLEVAELRDVENRGLVSAGLSHLLGGYHRPEPLHVHRRAVEPVAELVEVTHTDLAEVPGMVLVEEDAVVVHASGVTATSRMLAVLAHTPVPGGHMAALLAVLLEARRHGRRCSPPLAYLRGVHVLAGISPGVMVAAPADGVRVLVCPSSHRTRTRVGSSLRISSITPVRPACAARSDSTTIRSPA
jgi:hypothetical protein